MIFKDLSPTLALEKWIPVQATKKFMHADFWKNSEGTEI